VKRLALLGWPAGHSLSPAIHNAAFRALDLPFEYDTVEVASEGLAAALDQLCASGFCGGNVTVPHKEAIVPLCDEVDDVVRRVGAVNTLVHRDGRLSGSNTDVLGFRAALEEIGIDLRGISLVVLGAGGAARAVAFAAHQDGAARIAAVARRPERARAFVPLALPWQADALSDVLGRADLLVNASAAGMPRQIPPCDPPLDQLRGDAVVFDLVYQPRETPLLAQARRLGLRTIDGTRMLLHQGAASFRVWTGRDPPFAVMESALDAAL